MDARTLAQGVLFGAVLYVLASVWAFEVGLPAAIMSVASGEFPAGIGMNRNILSYTVVLALPFAVAVRAAELGRACPVGCRGRERCCGACTSAQSDTGLRGEQWRCAAQPRCWGGATAQSHGTREPRADTST